MLLLPALVWGYGKAVLRLTQKADGSSVEGESVTGHKKLQVQGQRNGTRKVDLKVSAPAQTGLSSDSEVVNRGKKAKEDFAVKAKPSEVGRKEIDAKIEPDLPGGTYNQIRVKKPSIPSRFEATASNGGLQNSFRNESPFSFFGLLGVPTLVFSLLFFVMWGIISGKIQRIMF